jgi:quercetin dioxygenase-like cupin family protein
VLAELLLRGAQAMGELRARAARMEAIEDLAALKPIVDGLVERKLMLELSPAGRGQLVTHNLYLPSELQAVRAQQGKAGASAPERATRPESGPRLTEVKLLALAELTPANGSVATFQGGEHGADVSFFVVAMRSGEGPKRHRHAYEETFLLLEGEVRLVTDGTTRTLAGGSIAVIPAGMWHQFTVTSEQPARMVTVHPVPRIVTEWAD